LIGKAKRERALEMGMEPGPESFSAVYDLPTLGMHGGVEEVEVDGETRIRVHDCVMGRVWTDLGKGELGWSYCMVDPASSMAFDPDHKLVHIKAIPDGDSCCELVMRPSTEEDKAEFAAEDTDWKKIEG
jgi:hypothetical protein